MVSRCTLDAVLRRVRCRVVRARTSRNAVHALGVHNAHGVHSEHGQGVANGWLGRQQGIGRWWRCTEGPVGKATRPSLPRTPQADLGVHGVAFGQREKEGGVGLERGWQVGSLAAPGWLLLIGWGSRVVEV
jgi:hypothetical protein